MHVEESKKTSLFWHNLWRINGSPRQGTIADIMRRTQAKYHYAIHYVKRMSETFKKQAMARAISENNSRELWQEVKKIRKNKSEKSYCIDNAYHAIGEHNFASLFANKYEELYNSVRYDEESFSSIISENTDDIKSQCIVSDVDSECDIIHTHSITVQQIKCAISKMQSGKSDSIEQLSSDNFKNGTHMLNVYISLLFTCMLTHGIPPSGLLLSTIIPIPKNNRGNMSDSSNYRAIALSSLLCKLFDTIIIETHEDNLITDDLQFGYKKQSSTIVCTSLLLNTVEYYRENDSDCYMLLLDASKAFDRVEYVKLFSDLRERKLCPIVLRLIMNMYVNQCLHVRLNSLVSDRFSIANGVKQGGVLSPILFSIYMDKLIKQLRNSNIGCKILNQYVGVFCYADDISLLCPSITGPKQMVLLCETYAEEYNIRFNSSKSQLIRFTDEKKVKGDISIEMKNGSKIKMVDKCKYLATTLYSDVKLKHTPDVVRDLTVSLNNLLADFSFIDSSTLSRLFDSYCMNLYGSPFLDIII